VAFESRPFDREAKRDVGQTAWKDFGVSESPEHSCGEPRRIEDETIQEPALRDGGLHSLATRGGALRYPSFRLSLSFVVWLLAPLQAGAAAVSISSQTKEIDGKRLHYLTAGQGPALILLHGYTETSRMWKPILPRLAEKFTVIAPDLPGIGDSDIPDSGLDMKSAAVSVHALARSLGVEKARVVGHDIGLMVAYAYAAQFPSEVEKLVVMDAFLPGVEGWEPVYDTPSIWHFRFNGPTPEALVEGRERIYFDFFWNDFAADKTRSVPEEDRAAYAAAYARPGRMHAGWAYFVSFQQAAKDFAELSRAKLTMPVLAIGGDRSMGEVLARQMKLVATDVKVVILKDTGHWVMEERPQETADALVSFL
jgi:pimeloyl-ACP methyl ester carboxylesterase